MNAYVSPRTGIPLDKSPHFLYNKNEKFPIINGIPRFVSSEFYSSSFGFQWNAFVKTQLDSHTNTCISLNRLERCLGSSISILSCKHVLEVGSGAGRFTEHLVKCGALVHSMDLSNAVEANKENIGNSVNYEICQADVYEIPFSPESFEYVICIGVIQHTPSSKKTIQKLWSMVKPGGVLVIDHYHWRLGYYFNPSTYFRFFLKRIPKSKAKVVIDALVEVFFNTHWRLRKNKTLTWILRRFSPLTTYVDNPDINLTKDMHKEWTKLDSFDVLTDYYKHLITKDSFKRILLHLNPENIYLIKGGNGYEARIYKRK